MRLLSILWLFVALAGGEGTGVFIFLLFLVRIIELIMRDLNKDDDD